MHDSNALISGKVYSENSAFSMFYCSTSYEMLTDSEISISSVIKGHHVYNYAYRIGERFKCICEDVNLMSARAIVVKCNSEVTTIGHVPDSHAKILWPLIKNGTVKKMKGRIIANSIRAPQGTWTFGGGIHLPCRYKLICNAEHKEFVKGKLRK